MWNVEETNSWVGEKVLDTILYMIALINIFFHFWLHYSLGKRLDNFPRNVIFHGNHKSAFTNMHQNDQLCSLQTFGSHKKICHKQRISLSYYVYGDTKGVHGKLSQPWDSVAALRASIH